jgi:hypothetical protein
LIAAEDRDAEARDAAEAKARPLFEIANAYLAIEQIAAGPFRSYDRA